jgi:hypothetical protein
MPCSDGRENTHTVYVESGNQTKRLCAVFTVLMNAGTLETTLDKVDWKEAGVSRRSTEEWWVRHQAEDRQRKARERAQKQADAERKAVLQSLTPLQKKVLGLK